MYDGSRHHEVWLRNQDGREWLWGALPLQVPMHKGQRIAFAWCSARSQAGGRLVGVQNFSTGDHKLLCQGIAASFGTSYGLRAFLWVAAVTAVLQLGQFMSVLPPWWPALPLSGCVTAAFATALAGFAYSCSQDPDPSHEVDRAIELGLAAMQFGWQRSAHEASHENDRRRPLRQSKRNSARASEMHALPRPDA